MEEKGNVTEELFSALSDINKDKNSKDYKPVTAKARDSFAKHQDNRKQRNIPGPITKEGKGANLQHKGNSLKTRNKVSVRTLQESNTHYTEQAGSGHSIDRFHKSTDVYHGEKYKCEVGPSFKTNYKDITPKTLYQGNTSSTLSASVKCNVRDEKIGEISNLEPKELGSRTKTSKGFRGTGYKFMEKLAREDAMDIVMKLANTQSGFDEMLRKEMFPELLFLTVKVLAKVCLAAFQHNKTNILITACQQKFLDQLEKQITSLATQEKESIRANILEFLDNLLTFYEGVLNLLPNTACEKFKKMFIITSMSIGGVETYQSLNCDKIKKRFESLEVQLKNMIEEREKSLAKETSKNEQLKYLPPPDNFRNLDIYPTANDFSNLPFLRPSIIKGAYIDVDHYLDVQFRLLREDFIGPLRDGISQYMESCSQKIKKIKRFEHVRVYRDVSFKNTVTVKDKVGLVLSFDPHKRFKDVQWEFSKRFMFGSLLCFTRDNFGTLFFGTVLDRNKKELENGFIVVELHNEEGSSTLFDCSYTMAESEVYFEPYNQVLNALQTLPSHQFPMKPYIIDGITDVGAPLYLLANESSEYSIDDFHVSVLNQDSWPTAEDLKLDPSQYRSFKSALTKEFVIIQGPPGTGKTFLGLKIAETLLENFSKWRTEEKPILVVCYTNHALDQFLEGILEYTSKIIRVGGQSHCPALDSFNLKEVRRSHAFKRSARDLSRDIFMKMQDIMSEIQSLQKDLQRIISNEGIVSIHSLKDVLNNKQQLEYLKGVDHKISSQMFLDWLYDDIYVTEESGTATMEAEVFKVVNSEGCDNPDDEIEELRKSYYRDEYEFEINVDILQRLRFDVDILSLSREIQEAEYDMKNCEDAARFQEMKQVCDYLHNALRFWKHQLSRAVFPDGRTIERLNRTRNLWDLSNNDRWSLYWYWLRLLHNYLMQRTWHLQAEYCNMCKQYEELRNIEDLDIMREAFVIGMTTTGAARKQSLLQELRPKIVIVEEAAEVLESHIVVSLTKDCEHLILIGDHKQLRPSTAVFELARKYNFDISLFERMLRNGMHCDCLEIQHRMREQIAKLITPTIYPKLLNHSSVLNYQNVRGVTKNLFFINHGYYEQEVKETVSHRNIHEADFLLELCKYLLLQGYEDSEITILTTYSGQMHYMNKVKKNSPMLGKVRITVVDNFQGEENKIILLSLVRSNEEAKIGFLRVENRVCVALSRAREGFFIIGNMDNLTKSSKIWPPIKETLESENSFGTHLTLKCQVHPAEETKVASALDFKAVPEGGCSLPCGALLPCGHICPSVCHVKNRFHEGVKCYCPCERIPVNCKMGHICLKKCFENCDKCEMPMERELPCGHTKTLPCHIDITKYECKEKVEIVLEACGHSNIKNCYQDMASVRCLHPCEDRLECGHSCVLTCHATRDPDHLEYVCHKPCERKNAGCTRNHKCNKRCYEECGACMMEIEFKLDDCGHVYRLPCSTDVSTVKCKRDCQRIMSCGHKCRLFCFQKCGNCQVKVEKTIKECGHKIKTSCCKEATRKDCKKTCEKRLNNCGHRCQNMCCNPCTSKCQELVASNVRPACGHSVEIPCHLQDRGLSPFSDELLFSCQMPCGKLLDCEHKCHGLCGRCFQGRLHEPCQEKCGRLLICGHSCNVNCAKNCPPCEEKCQYKCKHSRCNKRCGVPCVPCKERCESRCKHSRCNKLCYEICDRIPCEEPCDIRLKCGHQCVGFCGEPCPPLCRECNKEELTTVFLGFEDDDDARFILLVDCGHTVESRGLEMWMEQTDGEISIKNCPRCKTEIKRTLRFMNHVKEVYKDISSIKRKLFGNNQAILQKRTELLSILATVVLPEPVKKWSLEARNFLKLLQENLVPHNKGKRNFLSSTDVNTLSTKIEILSDLLKSVSLFSKNLDIISQEKVVKKFDLFLKLMRTRNSQMSSQEVSDYNFELTRFLRFANLCSIESSPEFKSSRNQQKIADLHTEVIQILNNIEKFTASYDEIVKALLADLNRELQIVANHRSQEERKQIVKAMGMQPGHWYKCPNGHYYAIGECGGAMEVSKCIECGAKIGGTQHHLLGTNRHAPEIDGSRAPAWPQ